MRKEEKTCIDCGKIGVKERNRCEDCAKEHNRQRSREHYKKNGRVYYGIEPCPVCGKPMKKWKKEQLTHATCRPFAKNNDYNRFINPKTRRTYARDFVQSLGITVPKGHVIHHLDENPMNNVPENLVIMTTSAHNSFHRFLQRHGSLFLKENSSNSENCWNSLRDHLTTAWMETSGAKVIKISDIGKSAAEPLNLKEKEEGSETMHGTPEHLVEGEDIVQTTTE